MSTLNNVIYGIFKYGLLSNTTTLFKLLTENIYNQHNCPAENNNEHVIKRLQRSGFVKDSGAEKYRKSGRFQENIEFPCTGVFEEPKNVKLSTLTTTLNWA